jgi:excisionase family DNA binding protein
MERIAPLFLRPVEAAALLGVSRSRLYEMLNTGSLPAVRLDGRTWRIPRAAIDKLATDAMTEHAAAPEQRVAR